MERAGDLIRNQHPGLVISKQRMGQADSIRLVRIIAKTGVRPSATPLGPSSSAAFQSNSRPREP